MLAPPTTQTATWQDDAACAGSEPGPFFSTDEHTQLQALEVCRGCPVREECLEHALRHGERFGIWGGMRERERQQLSRRRQRVA